MENVGDAEAKIFEGRLEGSANLVSFHHCFVQVVSLISNSCVELNNISGSYKSSRILFNLY